MDSVTPTTDEFRATDSGATHHESKRPPVLVGLTADDLELVPVALEADLAACIRKVYLSAWRQWEAWCRTHGVVALPGNRGGAPTSPSARGAALAAAPST